jgi:hypothetical protein
MNIQRGISLVEVMVATGFVIAIAIVVIIVVRNRAVQPEPLGDTNDVHLATTEVSLLNREEDTTTEKKEEENGAAKQEDNGTGEENPLSDSSNENGNPVINIPTSPYSVYIGFASSMATSSSSVLEQEVSEVVIGYEWESLPKSPGFATVVLPEWDPSKSGQEKYEVSVWDEKSDSYKLLGSYPSSEEIKLPREGFIITTKRFKVLNIDPVFRVCPGDRSFTWDFRFTAKDDYSLVRTPITQPLPQGELCQMRQ